MNHYCTKCEYEWLDIEPSEACPLCQATDIECDSQDFTSDNLTALSLSDLFEEE